MTHQEIIDRWNAQADQFNQWDALGEDEKLEWAMALEREACAKAVENYCGAWDDQGYALAQAIRARNN